MSIRLSLSAERPGRKRWMPAGVLALKAQNQARATLQPLGELKTPRPVALVKQASIGNQVQVNNGGGRCSA